MSRRYWRMMLSCWGSGSRLVSFFSLSFKISSSVLSISWFFLYPVFQFIFFFVFFPQSNIFLYRRGRARSSRSFLLTLVAF